MEKLNPDELDRLTGVRTQTGVVGDNLVIRTESDVSPNLAYADALRNADQYSSEGIKKGFFHAAHIPVVQVAELLKIGVDVFTAPAKEIIAGLRKINCERFITTRKRV